MVADSKGAPEMKKLLIVLLVLLVVVGGAAWYFTSFKLDGMIQGAIEKAGTDSLGTSVSVGKVQTNLKDGSLTISNITVANPPGFKNEKAFSLNNIEAAVDYKTKEIKRVIIDNPEIMVEELNGSTNIDKMLEMLDSAPAEPAPEGSAEQPVITIRHFRMSESRASFESASIDRYTDIKVDSVELTNLSGTPDELARVIGHEVLDEVVSAAAVELLKAKASEKLNDIFNRDKD
jgi:flagellar basal body-associated protein FliL